MTEPLNLISRPLDLTKCRMDDDDDEADVDDPDSVYGMLMSVTAAGDQLSCVCGRAFDVSAMDAFSGHVTSSVAAETDDVAENDPPGNPFGGVVMTAHSSMPAIPTSSMTSASDVVSRCPVRSVSLCQQDDVGMRCYDDGFGRLLSVDEDRLATRFASSIWRVFGIFALS